MVEAQMGLEDVGVIISLLKQLCMEDNGTSLGCFNMNNFGNTMQIYEKMRIPRIEANLARSEAWGELQQKRAISKKYNAVKEELIKRDVFFHETMNILRPGTVYDFKNEVFEALKKEPVLLPLIEE